MSIPLVSEEGLLRIRYTCPSVSSLNIVANQIMPGLSLKETYSYLGTKLFPTANFSVVRGEFICSMSIESYDIVIVCSILVVVSILEL